MFLGPSATGPNPDDTVRACPQHPPLLQTVPGTSGESVPQLNSYLANPDILRIGEKCTTAFPGAKPCCSHYLENAWNLKKKTTAKANVRSVSASTPFVLKSEKEEVISPPTAACPSCLCFQAEGQFLPLADRWACSPHPVCHCGGAASAAALPRAETSLHSWSVVNSSFGHWG